jgi:hypothetical protein
LIAVIGLSSVPGLVRSTPPADALSGVRRTTSTGRLDGFLSRLPASVVIASKAFGCLGLGPFCSVVIELVTAVVLHLRFWVRSRLLLTVVRVWEHELADLVAARIVAALRPDEGHETKQ